MLSSKTLVGSSIWTVVRQKPLVINYMKTRIVSTKKLFLVVQLASILFYFCCYII
uniref:Uncharacterized protein n=1 Tax=Anguilla anguilla TaxID=7936 RepID=A0A0E9V2E0_ANGAN